MTKQDPASIIKQAAEIASQVPEELREAAFNQAVDLLSRETPPDRQRDPKTKTRGKKSISKPESDDSIDSVLDEIDRTSHPDITLAPRVLERAMMVLRIAEADYDINGLNAPQIARVLTSKFKEKTSRQAVSQALDAAGNYVNVTKDGRSTKYQLMAPGEKHLDSNEWRDNTTKARSKPPKKRAKKTAASTKSKVTTKKKSTNNTSARRGTPSAGTLIQDLVSNGFFDTPKTIAHAIEHVQASQGRRYKANELSPSLLRLLRNNTLKRDKNTDGKYEYQTITI